MILSLLILSHIQNFLFFFLFKKIKARAEILTGYAVSKDDPEEGGVYFFRESSSPPSNWVQY